MSCSHRAKGRAYRHCQCPVWVDGTLNGTRILESLKMRSWEKASEIALSWESGGRKDARKRISDAWADFLADVDARHLAFATVRKYKLLKKQTTAFAEAEGFVYLDQLDLPAITKFRGSWKDGAQSSAKKLERLRQLFRFCEKRKWVEENPASELKAPKAHPKQTMPYTHDEMRRILAAAKEPLTLLLILVMRYSGLRVGDAVGLSLERVKGDRLFLYTAKSKVPVNLILPPIVSKALASAPKKSAQYFFWTGNGKLESAVTNWRATLSEVFKTARISGGHSHRFRDTFAVELLLAGVPIEHVSVLLGHQSVKITEKHYSPWAQARQEQLEADLRAAWKRDKLAESTIHN